MREIGLTTGGFFIIDAVLYDEVSKYKWGIDNNCYVRKWKHIRIAKGKYKTITTHLHKIILQGVGVVDHINGNKLDNRLVNLRLVDKSKNAINSGKCVGNKKSKYRGVSKTKEKWRAYAEYKTKKYYLGVYATEVEAAIARDSFWDKTGETFVRNIAL